MTKIQEKKWSEICTCKQYSNNGVCEHTAKNKPTVSFKDWVKHPYQQIADELYFLAQDGYGGEWREQKLKDIFQIVKEGIENEKKAYKEWLVRRIEKEMVNDEELGLGKSHDMALGKIISIIKEEKQ